MLSKSSTPENDVSYDFCDMIAGKFLKSEEYKNEKYSSYEMLESWVNDNKDFIREQHSLFIGETIDRDTTRMLDGGMYVIDLGYRNKKPVALIEKQCKTIAKNILLHLTIKSLIKKLTGLMAIIITKIFQKQSKILIKYCLVEILQTHLIKIKRTKKGRYKWK